MERRSRTGLFFPSSDLDMEPSCLLDPALKLAIFMEGAVQGPAGKMGFGVLRYSQNPIVCVVDSETAGLSIEELSGIPGSCPIVATVEQAIRLGADVLILGIAPPGGLIPESWWPVIEIAINAGLSVVNGLHDLVRLRFPHISGVPSRGHQFIWDIRVEPSGLTTGTAAAASVNNRRVLLFGTDMAIGKMTAGLEIYSYALKRGVRAAFVATGQIGITISGSGIPLDAIRVDFASGAVEREVVRWSESGSELVIVEGQGSLIHPGSTANLPLLRGACPTHLILCHKAGQTHLRNLPEIRIPSLSRFIRMYEDLSEACGAFPRPRTVAVALNTYGLGADEADLACREIEKELGIPCADPIRHGPAKLFDALNADL